MPEVRYRSILDAADVLAKLALIEARFQSIGTRSAVNLRVNDAAAIRTLDGLEARIRRLGTGTATPRITLGLSTRYAGVDPAIASLAALERQTRQLTAATGVNLGMTSRLGGVFAFIPGPIGLYASAASVLTGALTGLTAAQKLNTLGTFALAGGLIAVGAGAAGLAAHGIKQLKEFQAAVNTLNAQGDGLGDGFDARIRALQEGGGRAAGQFNRAELGTGVADLTKQGLDEAAAMKVLATSYKLAGAEGQNLNESSTLLLGNLRQFGLDGQVAADKAAHFGDVLAKGSLQAASGAKELQIGLSVVGPAANAMGLSLEETTGYLVAMDNAGLKASTIGANAFRAVLMALASPTGVARGEIEKLGVALKNADGSARPVRDVLIDLRKAAKISGQGYDEATKAAVRSADTVSAVSSIFRSRGVVGFLNMTDAADNYIKALEGSEGALDGYANALTEGPAKAQERLRKSVDDLALSFAQTFGPKLTAGLDTVTDIFRKIDTYTQRPDTIKAYFDVVVTGFGALTAAVILNSQAMSGLLAVSSWAGFVALLQGTVAGGLFLKAAAGLRALALATALNSAAMGGGVVNVVKGLALALGAVPIAAGAALAAVALLAGGVVVYAKKIMADTTAIYDEIDANAQKSQEQLMARVKEYMAQGPLGRLKAQQLLTISLRYQDGNTDEQNAALDAKLLKLKQQVAAEIERQAALAAASASKKQDATATLEQTEAYEALNTKLEDLRDRFADVKTTTFQKNLIDARKSLEQLGKEIDEREAKGEITPIYAATLRKRTEAAKPELVASISARQLDEDKKTIEGHQRELERARLDLIRDGRIKRQGEYDLEVKALRDKYGPEIEAALQNAKTKGITPGQRRGFQETAGQLQEQEAAAIKAAARKLDADLEQIDDERVKRVRDGAATNLSVAASEMDGRTRLLETEYKRQIDLTEGNVAARIATEQRLGPALEAARVAARDARLQAEQAALQNEYDDALRAARDSGKQREALETQAREAFMTKGRALEQAHQADVLGYHLSTISAIQEANATALSKHLERELQNAKEVSGVQLDAFARVLEVKRAAAVAEGDAPRAKALADALQSVADIQADNLRDFRDTLRDSGKEASGLREQLAGIAANPLEKAIGSATGPFDSVLKGAKEQLAELREAFAKVSNPTRDQTADFEQSQRALTDIVVRAEAERFQAKQGAIAKYDRELSDKSEETTLRLAKRALDLGRISLASYAEMLDADQRYWQARLENAVKGSDDEIAINAKLEENENERVRVEAERRELVRDAGTFAREELQAAVELAATERERSAARARLTENDRARLVTLDQEIAALTAQGGHEKELLALKRERLGLQKGIVTSTREEADAAIALTKAIRDRVEAEAKLAEKTATSDEDVAAARLRSLGNLRDQSGDLDRQIAAAKTDEERNRLTAERLDLTGQIVDLEDTIARAPLAIETQRLELLRAQNALFLQRAGLADDEVALGRQAVTDAENALRLARDSAALARTPDQRREGAVAVAQAELGVLQARNALLDAPIKADERRADVSARLARSALALSELSDDEVANAQLAVTAAAEQLALAECRLQVAGTAAEREAGAAKVAEARAALDAAGDNLRNAPVKAEERRLALYGQQAQARLVLNGLADSEVAAAELGVELAGRQLLLAQHRAEVAGTAAEAEAAASGVLEAAANLEQARAAARAAPVAEEERRLSLYRAQAQERRLLAGLGDDDVAQTREAVLLATSELRIAEQRLQIAGTLATQETAATDLANKRVALLQAERAAQAAILADRDAYLAQLKGEAQAQAQISGASRDAVASKALELSLTRLDLDENQRRLAGAREYLLTGKEIAALQLQHSQLLGQEAEQQRDLNRAMLEQSRLLSDLSEAATRSQLARSRFFDDGVALARLDLAAKREQIRLNEAEAASARESGLSRAELLGLHKARQALLADEAEAVRKLAEAERQREVFVRALGESLKTLNDAARGQGEGSQIARAGDDAARSLGRLREAEGAAQGFVARLREIEALLNRDAGDTWLFEAFQTAGDSADVAIEKVKALASAARSAPGGGTEDGGMLVAAAEIDALAGRAQAAADPVGGLVEQLQTLKSITRDDVNAALGKVLKSGTGTPAWAVAVSNAVYKLSQPMYLEDVGRDIALNLEDVVVAANKAQVSFGGVSAAAQTAADASLKVAPAAEPIGDSTRAIDGLTASVDQLGQMQADTSPFLAYREATDGKEKIDNLSAAISDYRAKLGAVADAYEAQISGIESVVQATLRLNNISGASGPESRAFALQVNEIQRQQALAETGRLLADQRATYGQIAAAAGRLAEAEEGRAAGERALFNDLAAKVQDGDKDATERLRQRLSSLSYSGQEVSRMLARVRKEGASALGEVSLRISAGAEDRLAELRSRALRQLSDVDRLRADAFRGRVDAAQEFEEYARLRGAVALASAGFNELEASQLSSIQRQETLNGILEKTSFLAPEGTKRESARAELQAENEALVRQVQLRRGIKEAAVTRADVAEQRRINAAVTDELGKQAALAQAALTPAREKVELGEKSAAAVKRETEALARQAAQRLRVDPAKITRAQVEEQRRLNEEIEKYAVLQKTRYDSLRGNGGGYNAGSPEVQSAILLSLAVEDAFYNDKKRIERAVSFERRKAVEVARAVAGDGEIVKQQIGAEIQRASAVLEALAPLQQKLDKERNEASVRSLQEALKTVKFPDLSAQAAAGGTSAGVAFAAAFSAAVRSALAAPLTVGVTGASGRSTPAAINNARTVTNNFGGFSFNITAQPGQDAEALANDVADILQRQLDQTGANCP